MSLRATRYHASQYGYNESVPVLQSLHPTPVPNVVAIPSLEALQLFGVREKGVHLVLFGDSRDPRMQALLALTAQWATELRKLVVVDIARLPQIAVLFGITQATLCKMFQQRILQVYEDSDISAQKIELFARRVVHPRWRYTDIR